VDFLVQRFGCTRQEAEKAAGKRIGDAVLGSPIWVFRDGVARAEENCDWLQTRLGLDEAELKRVVMKWPPVLGLSYEDNLEPSLAKLQERLGLKEAELKKVVLRLPSVLGYSYEDNLEPSLAKLQERLGLSEPELKKVVLSLPAVRG
jgi:mTERF domain-containing protein